MLTVDFSSQEFFSEQCSPFITQCLWSIGMDRAKSEMCYIGTLFTKEFVKFEFLKFQGATT